MPAPGTEFRERKMTFIQLLALSFVLAALFATFAAVK